MSFILRDTNLKKSPPSRCERMIRVVAVLVFALSKLVSCYSFNTGIRLFFSAVVSRRQSRTVTYLINNTVDTNMTDDDESPSISSLIQRARKVRENIMIFNNTMSSSSRPSFILDPSELSYPSSTYNMQIDDHDNAVGSQTKNTAAVVAVQRGYCNWLIPDTVMIGRYPGQTPETNGPVSDECQRHIQNMIEDAKITLFCCLQTEVPSQEDDDRWKHNIYGVYLKPESLRNEFPNPFTQYGPLAQSFTSEKITFLHHPIQDLGVPSSIDSLLSLLSKLLQHLEMDDDHQHSSPTIYLHCWGGIGRAALTGSCLASLLYPELSANEILDWIQQGYDTRAGVTNVHPALHKSPQTEQQCAFVKEFVGGVQTIARRLT